MSSFQRQATAGLRNVRQKGAMAGFTLIELLVAMAVFMVIAGSAFTLLQRHMPLYNQQQGQSALNVTLRNAVAQMQVDVVNAGSGFYPAINVPSWPIGLTITNAAGGAGCHTAGTTTYNAGCFDTLNIISSDPNTPPSQPDNGASGCANTTTGSLYLKPVAPTTAATLAADYKSGDEVLLMQGSGAKMTSVVLTAAGSTATTSEGSEVKLTFNATAADGTNTAAHDPLSISVTADNSAGQITYQFCAPDWAMRLTPTTYTVNATVNTNPVLTRTEAGTTNVIAEQIIGFKVGAMVYTGTADQPTYNFNASASVAAGGYNNSFDQIRSVLISLIGRTQPFLDPNNPFLNSFDGGPYRIEAIDVVVNPRNLTMNND
jgi:prepilin-type N-terminal cleavage/methylation domain-containing protein